MGRLVDPADIDKMLAKIAGARARAKVAQDKERQEQLAKLAAGGCEYCFNTGYLFDTWNSAERRLCGCEHGTEIRTKHRAEIERQLLAKSGITPRTRRFTLASYPDKASIGYRSVKAYCEGFDSHTGLIMLGPVGIGKTGLAVSAGQEILGAQIDAGNEHFGLRFTSYSDLMDALKAGFRDDSYYDTLNAYKRCSLLILDDVGSRDNLSDDVHAALSNWQLEQLFDIANYRYEQLLPSIITSNLKPEELRKRIGNRTVERWLDEDGGCFRLDMTGAPNLRLAGGAK